jgi:hypothetical protein
MHGLMGFAARRMLTKSLDSLLGVSGHDADVRRAQIRALYESRAEQTAGDIRAAVEVVALRARQAVEAQDKVNSRLRRINELTQRHETGQASFVELDEARLRFTEDRLAVTSAVLAWKRAIVDLRELQGALVAECRGGYVPMPIDGNAAERMPVEIEPLPSPKKESTESRRDGTVDENLETVAFELGIVPPAFYPTTNAGYEARKFPATHE